MKKVEKSVRIIHIVLCLLNVSSLFFGIMLLTGGENEIYRFFREISIEFCFPMLLMRVVYLQYILWGIVAMFTIVNVIYKIKIKNIEKKIVFVDCAFWVIAIFELIYLERYFGAIISF